MTEREKFIVPVRAVGARALLDFPDEVHFSAAPVKVRNSNVYIMCFTCICTLYCIANKEKMSFI